MDYFVSLPGMKLIDIALLSLAAGFTAGFFAGVFTGIGVLWGKAQPDAPFSVSLDFGGTWATEVLSTRNMAWAEALAGAIRKAMRQGRDIGGEEFIPGQDRLRN